MLYVVLGMHKSGTTLVSEIFHKSKIEMGHGFDADVSYDGGHKYEREEARDINCEILGLSLDVHSTRTGVAIDRSHSVDKHIRKRIHRLVQSECERVDEWGFKDPRTLLTYPAWASLLPDHRIIGVYRHPLQVVRHYAPLTPIGAWRALLAWCRHNDALLRAIEEAPSSSILIEFERMVTEDKEFARMEAFLGRSLMDPRRPSQFRNRDRGGWLQAILRLMDVFGSFSPTSIWQRLETVRAAQVQTTLV